MTYANLEKTNFGIGRGRPSKLALARQTSGFAGLVVLFVVFAAYGSAFNFAGQLRYVEALLLGAGLFYFDKFSTRVDRVEWQFSLLFLLTAMTQLVSNVVNQAPLSSTIGRVGTYVLLAALIPIVAAIVNRNWRRLLAVVLGFSCSFIVVTYTGSTISDEFNIMPWRLGLGAAATTIAVSLFAVFPRWRAVLTPGIFALVGAHLYFESRSMAAITLIVAIYCAVGTFAGRVRPSVFRLQAFVALVLALGAFAYIGPEIFSTLASAKLLPRSLVTKSELQTTNRYGLLAAARPDTFTALYAISNKPLLGYGSGVFDAEVFSYYARVNAASYQDQRLSRSVYKSVYGQEWSQGIPSHSHIFGAWADAGIVAALSWFFVLWVDLKLMARLWRWGHPFAPLFAFVGIETLWDVLCSPGPVRLDIAIRLVIMATALRYIQFSDMMAQAQSERPSQVT